MVEGTSIDEVRYDDRGAVAVVTMDRQHRRNAIDGRTAQALSDALDRFEADDEARVLVLTGAGQAFCAGADLTDIASLAPRANGPDGPLGQMLTGLLQWCHAPTAGRRWKGLWRLIRAGRLTGHRSLPRE